MLIERYDLLASGNIAPLTRTVRHRMAMPKLPTKQIEPVEDHEERLGEEEEVAEIDRAIEARQIFRFKAEE